MASVIFNSFKQRYLNGEVPRSDTWNFIPVNKNFTNTFDDKSSDFTLEQYRTLDDFANHNSAAWDSSRFTGVRRDITWFRPDDTSGTSKPMFITSGSIGEKGIYDKASNWEKFLKTDYAKDISANASIHDYLEQGGFYYIRTKEELRWFADHSNKENNRIIGVIGDDINGYIRGQIGKDEAYPYQGILDGNGHAIAGTIVCDNDDNGIVGVLGQDGIVKNFKLLPSENGNPSLLCKKQINIQHIKTDGRDINAGLLVGRNYGRVENIDGSQLNSFTFSGFVPQVYSVTNKSDNYNDFSTIRKKYDNGENFYFLNSWCINSPGNICPYVGYFAEGLYAQNAGGKDADGKYRTIELKPHQRATYYLGLTSGTIDLTENVEDVGWFIKYFGKLGEKYISNTVRQTLNYKNGQDNTFPAVYNQEPQRYCAYEDPYGRNMILILGFDAENEQGSSTRYFLELHGTAYDKKAGMGNRRFYFHAGHINLSQLPWLLVNNDVSFSNVTSVNIEEDWAKEKADEDGDPVEVIDWDKQSYNEADDSVTQDTELTALLASLNDRKNSSYFWEPDRDDGQAVPLNLNSYYHLNFVNPDNTDTEILFAAGFSWNNNHYDMSSFIRVNGIAEWLNKKFGSTKVKDKKVSHTEVDTGITTEYVIEEDDVKIFTKDGTPGKIVSKNISELSWTPKQEHSPTSVWNRMYTMLCADLTKKMTIVVNDDAGDSVEIPVRWKVDNLESNAKDAASKSDFFTAYEFFAEKGEFPILPPAEYLVTEDKNGNEGIYWNSDRMCIARILDDPETFFDVEYPNPTEHSFDNIKIPDSNGVSELKRQLRAAFLMNLPRMTYCRFDNAPSDWKDEEDWSGWSINDNSDIDTLQTYYTNRRVALDDGSEVPLWPTVVHTFRYWNVTINDDHVNEEAGELDFNLIDTKNLHYSPFVHAFNLTDGHVFDASCNFGTVWAAWDEKWTNDSKAAYSTPLEAASNAFHDIAKHYIQDPHYYGLDYNGDFTSQVVRPNNFNEQGEARGSLVNRKYDTDMFSYFYNSSIYKNTDVLHFNWNIEKMMFKDKRNGDLFVKYDDATLRNSDIFKLDLAHCALDKPMRMHNMARAAYNISPVVGSNYGHIANVVINTRRQNLGNFVGFIGGIAGKQERGFVEKVRANIEDAFEWYKEMPIQPQGIDIYNASASNAQMSAYNEAIANDNYHVRYKMTPIIPLSKSDAVKELGQNPIDDGDRYKYYPAGIEDTLDPELFPDTSADWAAVMSNKQSEQDLVDYLTTLSAQGKRIYRVDDSDINETTFSNRHSSLYSYFTDNPNYIIDDRYFKESKPIIDFATEWYSDGATTATMPLDDIVTFNLNPIFNAGGVFGRIIPAVQPNNKIELKTNAVYNKTYFNDINVTYKLSDTYSGAKDIHNAFGSFAGVMEMQTSELGQKEQNLSDKLIDMTSIAAVGTNTYSSDSLSGKVLPIGFVAQQFSENTSIVATESAGRSKGGNYVGADTDNTWAIDTPFIISTDMKKTDEQSKYAPINNVAAAFYGLNSVSKPTGIFANMTEFVTNLFKNRPMNAKTVENYTSGVIADVIQMTDVYANTAPKFTTWAPETIDMYGGKRNLQSIQSVFGSNTTFIAPIKYDYGVAAEEGAKLTNGTNLSLFEEKEQLDVGQHPRIYKKQQTEFISDSLAYGDAASFDTNALLDSNVFQPRSKTEDLYFSYSYSSTTSFVPDWTFKNDVHFTYALKDGDDRKISDDRKYVYGYVFSDYLTNSAEGFQYNRNYLHLGNSVSPSYIRRTIANHGPFTTSSVSAAYMNNGQIVSADDDHQFGGILITDSKDRNVAFIDNTNGAELDNLSYNIQCPLVHYDNTIGGMLVEVK